MTSAEPRTLVETKRIRLFDRTRPLDFVHGGRLEEVTVAYETYGTLNKARDNAVYICHALTGDAHAALWHEGDARPGWWDVMIGPGKAIDTNRWFVISSNLLGGCRGSTRPPASPTAWTFPSSTCTTSSPCTGRSCAPSEWTTSMRPSAAPSAACRCSTGR